jgi:nitroimidazol reductase NimA-like FMN-containing flavoprotein (pyridoxamine 5'-phosphate oxidase superfamily)
MDNVKLKEFVLKELQKEEFIVSNINEPLVDKLVAEFCEKNPHDWEELNVFTLSDEKVKEIRENIAVAVADGTVERIKYEQAVNHAGLAYHTAVMNGYMDELPDTEEELDSLMREIMKLK